MVYACLLSLIQITSRRTGLLRCELTSSDQFVTYLNNQPDMLTGELHTSSVGLVR